MMSRTEVPFESIVGQIMVDIIVSNDSILFRNWVGEEWVMHHYQDCCESVYVESIVGDMNDILKYPIRMAEEVTGETPDTWDDSGRDSYTWTFYKLATDKGYVDIRWLGESSGYYSESVSFEKVK